MKSNRVFGSRLRSLKKYQYLNISLFVTKIAHSLFRIINIRQKYYHILLTYFTYMIYRIQIGRTKISYQQTLTFLSCLFLFYCFIFQDSKHQSSFNRFLVFQYACTDNALTFFYYFVSIVMITDLIINYSVVRSPELC